MHKICTRKIYSHQLDCGSALPHIKFIQSTFYSLLWNLSSAVTQVGLVEFSLEVGGPGEDEPGAVGLVIRDELLHCNLGNLSRTTNTELQFAFAISTQIDLE